MCSEVSLLKIKKIARENVVTRDILHTVHFATPSHKNRLVKTEHARFFRQKAFSIYQEIPEIPVGM